MHAEAGALIIDVSKRAAANSFRVSNLLVEFRVLSVAQWQ